MRHSTSMFAITAALAAVTVVSTASRMSGAQAPAGLALVLADYAALPITGELAGQNTRGLLSRVNFMRDEPGGRRFFVNDLNGPLYILDKQTKAFATYLDFNGLGDRPGLFRRLTFERNFATGLINFVFDPDYTNNGVFYTMHMEDPTVNAPAEPRAGAVAGLDVTGYRTTASVKVPVAPGTVIDREVVLIEWTDRNPANATFEGTARELLRVDHPAPIHPVGEMTFNPVARPGDADWRVMYIGAGDAGSGEQKDIRRMNPQRLDTLVGKILRIVPDLGAHTATSTVSENGRYRIPNDNPFVALDGARGEIWASGLRNPHRLTWHVDPARPGAPALLAFNIGLVSWETIVVIHKGANYGYSLREGTQTMSLDGMSALPADDVIPVRISDTVTRGTVRPVYPVAQYPHTRAEGGDAIAGGFVYRGTAIPELQNKVVFGDITTGRIWYVGIAELLAADDGIATTLAPIHEMEVDLRGIVTTTYRARGGAGQTIAGTAAVGGAGRVDLRFAIDGDGELYVLTKSDGMIRKIVGVRPATAAVSASTAASGPRGALLSAEAAAALANPVAPTAESLATGKRVYDANCAACHGNAAQGAVRAGTAISIIEEQRGKQPPDLTDAQWDHGSSDGSIFGVIKRGVPPTMMAGYDGRIPDAEIWSLVNYLRSLGR